MNQHTPLELSELISASLERLGSEQLTVRGTLHDLNVGHRWGRGRLIQDDPAIPGASLARIEFGLPGSLAREISATSARAGTPIVDGKTIDVTGTLTYHPTFGLRLTAEHIAVVGDSDAAIRAAQLRATLTTSTAPTNQGNLQVDFASIGNVALICPANGRAGETDAITSLQAELAPYGVAHPFIKTIGIPMSGPNALRELEGTLASQSLSADLFLIVRGGGSAADLTMWDHERTCKILASCTKPVVLGIGHTTDKLNADLIVYRSAATPTAAGRWLGEQLRSAAVPVTAPLLPAMSVPPPPRPTAPPPPRPVEQHRISWRYVTLVVAVIVILVVALAALGALR